MYSTEEPDFDEVIKFRNNPANFPNYTRLMNKPPVMTRASFVTVKDQIIRGWVCKEDPPHSSFLALSDINGQPKEGLIDESLTLILKHEREYPGFDWYDNAKTYGVVFVKGHGLEKKLFFEWSPEVVFYCPTIFPIGPKFSTIKKDIEIDQKPVNNRFIGEKLFHYLDRKRKKWICFRFDQFNEIGNLFKSLLQGTDNCGGNTITAINRLR